MEDNTWSYLLARAKGVPECTYGSSGIVGEIASATADFRDQYYGLVGLVREAGSSVVRPTQMKLATVGLIDLGEFLWGLRSTRFAKTKYTQPVVEVSELPKRLGDWANSRKRPKIMVSNQTRIVEVFVDEVGDILPSVPILTVDCGADDLWRVAASLASPVASILDTERHLGAGMSADVIKMSARDLLNLPLPTNSEKWSEGSELFQRIQAIQDASVRIELLAKFGHVMCDAFEAPSKVFDWWWSRIPKRTQES
jgi:hypothetical protein